jgi:cytochrome c-type biogenesis protein CcmH
MSANGGSRTGRTSWWPVGALATALLVAGLALTFAAIRGPTRPATINDRVDAVASTIRCPVCQNLSVADSPSRLAAEMRREIEAELRAGRTPAQIRAELAEAYGEWILQAPPKQGINLVAWLAPVLLLVAGGVAAVLAVRSWTRRGRRGTPPPSPEVSTEDRARLQRALAEEDRT